MDAHLRKNVLQVEMRLNFRMIFRMTHYCCCSRGQWYICSCWYFTLQLTTEIHIDNLMHDPPWVRCSPFNGSMLFLVMLSGPSQYKWIFVLAVLIGVLYTVCMTVFREKEEPRGEKEPPADRMQVWIQSTYTLLENGLLIAGIAAHLDKVPLNVKCGVLKLHSPLLSSLCL